MRLAALLSTLLLTLSAPAPAAAESLGWGRLMTNDVFAGTKDRWRTGAYVVSNVRGSGWSGERPATPGEIVELRFRGEVIAPASLVSPGPADRRFAGTLSLGLHTHFNRSGLDYSLGADLVLVGPQTNLDDWQRSLHDLLNQPIISDRVRSDQIEDAVRLGFTGEIARPVQVSDVTLLRPFVEITTAPETLARLGVDVIVGVPGQGDLLLRDVTTGHLYRGTDTATGGHSLVVGADITQVIDSLYLPDGDRVTRSDTRYRLRGGWHWQIARETSFFYGVTYLSEEFDEQSEGQVVGSLKLNFNF